MQEKYAFYKIITIFIHFLVISNQIHAQTFETKSANISFEIPELAQLCITPSTAAITFQLGATSVDGKKISTASTTNNSKWINYTSILKPDSPLRNISAQIIDGKIPNGTSLHLTTNNYEGLGEGQHGKAKAIVLSHLSQHIITNIGGAATGKGQQGHQLSYVLKIIDYSLLNTENANTLTVVYTLAEN